MMVTKLRRAGRQFIDGERGVALPVVMFVGAALLLITTVITMRSITRINATGLDADWESAVHVADTGLNVGLSTRHNSSTFSTGETVPVFSTPDQEKDWVIAAAASADVVAAAGGEYALVMPADAGIVYAVGYVPARGAPGVRTRVVRANFEVINFVFNGALISGGDVELAGNAAIVDLSGGTGAAVHSNGTISVSNQATVDGCVTSSETTLPASGGCDASPVEEVRLPEVDPRVFYPLATLVLCPDGTVRAGPMGSPFFDDTPATPCDVFDPIVNDGGWSSTISGGDRVWDPKKVNKGGVVYVYQGSIDGKIGKEPQNDPVDITLLIEGLPGWRTCSAATSGNLSLSSGSYIVADPSMGANGIAVVATGDVYYRGGASVGGAILTNEQIDYRGGPHSTGPVLATSKCDLTDSPVDVTTVLNGGAGLNFDGGFDIPLEVGINPTDWAEL